MNVETRGGPGTHDRGPDGGGPHGAQKPPSPRTAALVAGLSVVVIAVSAWVAAQPGADRAQTGVVTWLNHPPQPLAAVLAGTNPLFRPLPLTFVVLALAGWVLITAAGARARWEVLRAGTVGVLLAELIAQPLKRAAGQARPTASIAGLNTHGYPKDPFGHAYPSAHTSVAVGVVCALWPWMRTSQRVAGVTVAVLVALNRVYIGAHWPVDLLGGAAIGLLSGSSCWLIATRWPIASREQRSGNI